MNKRNYQKELEQVIDREQSEKRVPTLLLHSCCAPCSSYVLEYLSQYFSITVFYYNPNISRSGEYRKRVEEQKRLIALYNQQKAGFPIRILEGDYEPEVFFREAAGLEKEPEGGERCRKCFMLRLEKTAKEAQKGGYDYFGTTLTISPLKNAVLLNEIGESLALRYQVNWLFSDFKKKNGYKRSVELSKEYDLYRQDYCGCIYSETARLKHTVKKDLNTD